MKKKTKIKLYFECGKCIDEYMSNDKLKSNLSPKDYQLIECGWTKKGFQVWCKRHDCNIIHIDFEGTRHPVL